MNGKDRGSGFLTHGGNNTHQGLLGSLNISSYKKKKQNFIPEVK